MSAGQQVELTIDERVVAVAAGTTILDAAASLGIRIPVLCHQPNMTPVGVCRVCVVEVQGARVLPAACVRPVEPGMVVSTTAERVRRARRTLVELLMADHPTPCVRHAQYGDCELEVMAEQEGVRTPRFSRRPSWRGRDDSSLIIAVDHDACILCDRCIRGCDDIRENFVIGRTGKGYAAGIAFDDDKPMGESSCVACGECVVSCPTGALTNKAPIGTHLDRGEPVSADELLKLPIFKGVSSSFLAMNRGAVIQRHVKRGEIICREGEPGSTAFYIVKGKVDVFLETPIAHVKSHAGAGIKGFFRKVTGLVGSREDPRDEEPRRWIPIDGPVDLPYDNPIAQFLEGDLFGEMTCMSFYPRSATVRAAEDTVLLEMLRNVLYILQKNRHFKARLDESYRRRALETHLRSVDILAGLPDEFVHYLCDRAGLLRFEPGQMISRQGDPADSFYLIRMGFVKITQRFPGGEVTLAYPGRGSYFGEIGLLGGGTRVATCTALDHVEVVRINSEDFSMMVERFPDVRRALMVVAEERQEENRKRLTMTSTVSLDDFLNQGLMEATNVLLIDLERCTRCDLCVNACAAAHDGVTRLIREGLRYDKYLVTTSCRQCRDPLCMVGCPVGSIRRKQTGKDAFEIVIEDWCIGCGLCAENCPYGNINMHDFTVTVDDPESPGHRKAVVKEKATTCDLSMGYSEPACVVACPHEAAIRVNPATFFAEKPGGAPSLPSEGAR
ncbi:MAG: cyclic nucleotide-binding domain-containing protein [Anaerolineae bacterium]